jgi:hypothetical protein
LFFNGIALPAKLLISCRQPVGERYLPGWDIFSYTYTLLGVRTAPNYLNEEIGKDYCSY